MTNPPVDVDPPLSLEPVVGWRTWGLDRAGGALTLRSVTRPDHWPAREAMVARCLQHRAGTVPEWYCTCGLYAVTSPEHLVRSGVLAIESGVVGTVSMWGRLIEHPFGARSRFAYPARLRLVCGRCLALGAGAVTPVMVLGEPRIARGRLRSALVRSGGSCRPRRRGTGGTPVHVRRGAVADRTALGRPPRPAGPQHTATRSSRHAGNDRPLERLVARRRRVSRRSCHR